MHMACKFALQQWISICVLISPCVFAAYAIDGNRDSISPPFKSSVAFTDLVHHAQNNPITEICSVVVRSGVAALVNPRSFESEYNEDDAAFRSIAPDSWRALEPPSRTLRGDVSGAGIERLRSPNADVTEFGIVKSALTLHQHHLEPSTESQSSLSKFAVREDAPAAISVNTVTFGTSSPGLVIVELPAGPTSNLTADAGSVLVTVRVYCVASLNISESIACSGSGLVTVSVRTIPGTAVR